MRKETNSRLALGRASELFFVDVWEFDKLIGNAIESDNADRLLQEAANLYRGELLQGIYYPWGDDLRSLQER